MITRFKLLPRPRLFSVTGHAPATPDHPTVGKRLAEQVAALVGSWWFLGGQAFFLFLWLIYNTVQFTTHFDPPPYILLHLLLSFQAAFTGPVLLIAANVGAIRDHKQADRIEQLAAQSTKVSEQNEQLVERLFSIEQTLEEHVTTSLQAHTNELRELGIVLRAVHAAVSATPSNGCVATATGPAMAGAESAPLADAASPTTPDMASGSLADTPTHVAPRPPGRRSKGGSARG